MEALLDVLETKTILDAVFDDVYNIPEFKEIDFSAEELNKYAGIYTNLIYHLK